MKDRGKIEAGQVWRQRNGKTVEIDQVLEDNGSTPVKSGADFWQENGRFWSDEFDHKKDLIEKIH